MTQQEFILDRSEEHTSELQSPCNLVCRLLLEKKKKNKQCQWGMECSRMTSGIECIVSTRTLTVLLRPSYLTCHSSFLFFFFFSFFFFNDTATTEFSPLPLHAALPISFRAGGRAQAPLLRAAAVRTARRAREP